MANTLAAYNPIFYAQEGLIQLEKALGMAARVHRGYDNERQSFRRGQTVTIRKPSTFTAQNAPSTAQDILSEQVDINLSSHKEVKFVLTDKELAYTGEQIIADHIRPAAYALADQIDTDLNTLYKDIPNYYTMASSAAVTDLTGIWATLFNSRVPMSEADRIHLQLDGTATGNFLALSAFTQHQGAGEAGVLAQMRGSLGLKFGMEVYANQNGGTRHVPGAAADNVGSLVGAHAKGVSTIVFDLYQTAGTFKQGDIVEITNTLTGTTQRHVAAADATASSGTVTLTILPSLRFAAADNDVVTAVYSADKQHLAYHENAFALVVAPLPETGDGIGARISTISSEESRLSLRARVFYMPDDSEVRVALDVLYGFKTLDPDLAARGLD